MVLESKLKFQESVDLFIAPLGEKAQSFSFALANKLRLKGIRTETEYEDRPLKGLLKKADRLKSRFTLMIGEEELAQGEALLRDMTTKKQVSIPFGKLLDEIPRIIEPRLIQP